MALLKPVVIKAGQLQRIQAGDVIDSALAPEVQTVTNANAGAIVIGRPVFISAADSVDLAQANSTSTSQVIGLVFDASIASAASGLVLTDGVLAATTTQWDVVTGQTGGLTAGAEYYLSPTTVGGLTTTAPDGDGQVVAPVGVALGTTKLRLGIKPTVLL